MKFKKYQHLERYGNSEVEGIEIGESVIFPKIDGTNASVWLDNGVIQAGSRNRQLTLDNDNAGFYAYVSANQAIQDYLKKHPTHRLYGEWLVPHSLKTYREDAWGKFYVFDVCENLEEDIQIYIPYNEYQPLLEEFGLDYIPPLATIKNASYENIVHYLENNNFLIQDGKGNGEGIVIKNYNFKNKYGRQVWAKIVTSEFKEKHIKTMGAPNIDNNIIEQRIIDDFVTKAYIEKEFAKFTLEKDGFSSKYIPELLGKIWHEFIKEESWNIIKKYKSPTINYKTLNFLCIKKIKESLPEVF